MPLRRLFLVGSLLVAFAGCSSTDADADHPNCVEGGTSFAEFDPDGHDAQDLQVKAQLDIRARASAAAAAPDTAADAFADIEAIYEGSGGLKDELTEVTDERFPDAPGAASAGKDLDAAITSAIAKGKAAKTALEVKLAAQVIDKSLTSFYSLAVWHELAEGSREGYDEAFGYLGTGRVNDPAKLTSLAAIARERDAELGTTMEPDLFQDLREGACKLGSALEQANADEIELHASAAYAAEVTEIGELTTKVLAASVVHEFEELDEQTEEDEAKEELVEGAVLFGAIERAMRAAGASADADAIRAQLDQARSRVDAGDPAWRDGLDPETIRDRVAAAFGL